MNGRRNLLRTMAAACLLAGCVATPRRAVLSGDDQTALSQVDAYLGGLQRFQANFTETGPSGAAEGIVWVDRPGRMRVEYYRPRPKLILANRGRLLLADRLTGSTTTLPVSKTPLDILLGQTVPLSGPVTIASLQRQSGFLQLSLVKTAQPGQGTLTLRFAEDPLALAGVTIHDRTGAVTSLDLRDLIRDPDFGPSRFEYQPVVAAGS